MNSPRLRPCARCTHDVTTAHFEESEFVCARATGDDVVCGSCGEEVARGAAKTSRHEALARHFREQHPELSRGGRFRERTVQGARYLFYS